jgi:Ni,Fe-hydrogenase III large subunit
MSWHQMKALDLIHVEKEPPLTSRHWLDATAELLAKGARPISVFRQGTNHGDRVWMAFAPASGCAGYLCLTNTLFAANERRSYAAFSYNTPRMNYFECELYEQTGIEPERHPWLRPVRAASAWHRDGKPYSFYRVEGEEVHEVAVGPVHAGIIEPGHFRFHCHGEEILHLEIQLGYQHRGIEELLPQQKPAKQLVLVESIAGDSAVAHTIAFCSAIEALAGVSPTLREQAVRGIAAELERVAMHLATLSGLATDIGFALPSAAFGGLRTAIINLTARICGSRFGRGWIVPGGVRFDLDLPLVEKARQVLHEVLAKFFDIEALFFNSSSVLARLEEIGTLSAEQARSIGLVGLAARASGIACDVRADFPYGIYRYSSIPSPTLDSGDVYARAKLRALEIRNSIDFIFEQLDLLPAPKPKNSPEELAKNAFTIALTEGHRGEIAHVLRTDGQGRLAQVKIKDPSFHNWYGLALAVRENAISDFPLCNKSFDLSYAGHDL